MGRGRAIVLRRICTQNEIDINYLFFSVYVTYFVTNGYVLLMGARNQVIIGVDRFGYHMVHIPSQFLNRG